jgi:uncharacterized integral membrane protein
MADEPEPRQAQVPATAPTASPKPEPVQQAAPPPHPEHETRETFQPLLYAKIAALLFVVAYTIAFVVDNNTKIPVDFVFATANVSLIWTILLLLAVGLVGGILLSQLYRHRRRARLTQKPGKSRDSRADVGGRDKAVGKPS